MTMQITIVGLGQIGASIGLALANREELLQRVGHDHNQAIARQAKDLGAVDRAEGNLHKAVRGADLVVLSLPFDQIRETIQLIVNDLKENAVLMDTSPVKAVVVTWADELLPTQRQYVGLTPVIRSDYLHETTFGIEAARADLFHNELMAIVASQRTNSDAIKLAVDLTHMLGAEPMFADPVEMDGLMAATHLLPQLMAAALLNATTGQPGWRDGRKIAGRAYAESSAAVVQLDSPRTLMESTFLNRENVLRVLDDAIAALHLLRGDIDAQDRDALVERLEQAREGRVMWWGARQVGGLIQDGAPVIDLPDDPGVIGRLFGIGWSRKPKDET